MNELHKKLIASMLEDYSCLISRNICNDWNFPDDWTLEQRKEFCIAYHNWNGDPEEFDPENLTLPDYAVASFLSDLILIDNKQKRR